MGWISRAKSTCPAGAVTGVGACALSNAATELAANKARTIEGTRGIGTPSIKLFDVHQDTRNRQEIQPRTRRFLVLLPELSQLRIGWPSSLTCHIPRDPDVRSPTPAARLCGRGRCWKRSRRT